MLYIFTWEPPFNLDANAIFLLYYFVGSNPVGKLFENISFKLGNLTSNLSQKIRYFWWYYLYLNYVTRYKILKVILIFIGSTKCLTWTYFLRKIIVELLNTFKKEKD